MKPRAFRGLWLKLVILVALVMGLELVTAQEAEVSVELLETTDDYRLIRHDGGDTRVPLEPKRIVALGDAVADSLLALGVEPSAYASFRGSLAPYLAEGLEDATYVGNVYDANLEAILATEPDLILGHSSELEPTFVEQLSRIAPTVLLGEYGDVLGDLHELGTILGMPEAAEVRIATYKQKLETARRRLERAVGNETVAVLRVRPREVRIYRQYAADVVYDGLGLAPAALVPEDSWGGAISLETLPELGAEHIFVIVDGDAGNKRHELFNHPLWRGLDAVQQGNVYEADTAAWFGTGVLGKEQVVEDVLGALTKE